jgi:hypothetical protein
MKGTKMKTFNFVLLFALSVISTSAMSVQAELSPEMDAAFIQTVKKIATDHHFFVQEYKGVVRGMNNRGFYFIANQEDKSWEITPADTWNNPKIKGTTTEDFQSEMSKIHK